MKKKLTKRQRLEKELNSLWGKLARKLGDGQCQWPGCKNTDRLTAHHYFHKAQGNVARWSLENSVILCFAHHIYQVHSKGDVEPIRDVLLQKIGPERFDILKSEVRASWKPTDAELQAIKDKWTAMLQEVA